MSPDLQDLRASLGGKGLLTAPNDMAPYCADLLGAKAAHVLAVARPANTDQVCETLIWCRRNGIGVVPQGGLTGLVNGAVPAGQAPEVILSLGRMNKIGPVDTLDNTMIVEAGAVLATVKQAAEAADRYFPLTHGGEGSSQIGGNLATNAGGNNALRYGTARDQVLGLEVVLPDGTVWSDLRCLRKNTAGYDLKQLFIGAEGTLGIITKACLKVRPFPRARETAFTAIPGPGAALAFYRDLEQHVGETIAAFELLSPNAVRRGLTIEGARCPFDRTDSWLALVELETAAERFDLKGALEDAIGQGLEDEHIVDAVIAQSIQHRSEFWRLREAIAEAFVDEIDSLKSDTAVPVGQVPAFIIAAGAAVEAAVPGAECNPFGHLGDGNIHFNVRRPDHMAPAQFRERWGVVSEAIEKAALGLGGTISAEHGIGRLKKRGFAASASAADQALLRALKKSIDPQMMMNEGAILDLDG